jgi:Mn-containing catalase
MFAHNKRLQYTVPAGEPDPGLAPRMPDGSAPQAGSGGMTRH